MEHFWRNIDGYFTFPSFYDWIARQASTIQQWRGVEVGVYTGQSVAFLGVQLLQYNAIEPTICLVDIEMAKHRAVQNLHPLAHTGIGFEIHELDSVVASRLYDDASLDFVFIDADHSYAAVSRDIDAWIPKVKKGGIIAGHDYCNWPGFGVIQAVTERFDRVEVWRGEKGMGDEQMKPHYWPVWCTRV